MVSETNDFLAHYGVKGMKWGVRKERRRAREAQAREDYKKMTPNEKRVATNTRNAKARRRKAVRNMAVAAGGAYIAGTIAAYNVDKAFNGKQHAKEALPGAKVAKQIAQKKKHVKVNDDIAQAHSLVAKLGKEKASADREMQDALRMFDRVVRGGTGKKIPGPSARDLETQWERSLASANLDLLKLASKNAGG